MIRRPPRSTQSRSSAASDVYKRQPLWHAVPCAIEILTTALAHESDYKPAHSVDLGLCKLRERREVDSGCAKPLGDRVARAISVHREYMRRVEERPRFDSVLLEKEHEIISNRRIHENRHHPPHCI